LEALGFSDHNSNQVMEVPGFLPGYRVAGDEIKSSRGRLGDNLVLHCLLIS
jgi:hypothetical protein